MSLAGHGPSPAERLRPGLLRASAERPEDKKLGMIPEAGAEIEDDRDGHFEACAEPLPCGDSDGERVYDGKQRKDASTTSIHTTNASQRRCRSVRLGLAFLSAGETVRRWPRIAGSAASQAPPSWRV
jgi:hypothetical protein